jgi:hypothetical protein
MQLLGVTAAIPAFRIEDYSLSLPGKSLFAGLGEFLNAPEAIVAAALRRLDPHLTAAGILCWEAGSGALTLVSRCAVREGLSVSACERDAAKGTRFAAVACANSLGALASGGATFRKAGECDLGAAVVALYRSRFARLGVVATGAQAALPSGFVLRG